MKTPESETPQILADENIARIRQLAGLLGDVRTLPGRSMKRAELDGVDLLFIRSVTRITAELLDGTPVRFVATATAGTDHVDEDYLRRRGIVFASAPGSNAAAVADYVSVALVTLAARQDRSLEGQTLGVIGHGHVGSRVASRGRALGMRVLVNDPPLARETGDPLYRPLDEVLAESDVVTLHCCLTRTGIDATWHLADRSFFDRMRRGSLFVNASRGQVVDEAALKSALSEGRVRDAILDVWEGEPSPDPDLIRRAVFASPHIGGYSVDGKLRGTQMVYEAACRFLGRETEVDIFSFLSPPEPLRFEAFPENLSREAVLAKVLKKVYDIEDETLAMKGLVEADRKRRAELFDKLRRAHGPRREFTAHTISIQDCSSEVRTALKGLGFHVG